MTTILGRTAATIVALVSLAASATATATESVDLKTEADAVFGKARYVAAAGDVNGDGPDDFTASFCSAEPLGRVYVVFGGSSGGLGEMDDLQDGFIIEASTHGNNICGMETPAGDLNGDGLDDLLVGSFNANNNERGSSGTVYVVFGKADTERVDLGAFDRGEQGDAGYRIDGPYAGARAGYETAGLGDVNGDGIPDQALTNPWAGLTYVVYGKRDSEPIDLLDFYNEPESAPGFMVRTVSTDGLNDMKIASAGDADGDGRADLVICAIRKVNTTRGVCYVVFGKSDRALVDARDDGAWGYRVQGSHPYRTRAGTSPAPVTQTATCATTSSSGRCGRPRASGRGPPTSSTASAATARSSCGASRETTRSRATASRARTITTSSARALARSETSTATASPTLWSAPRARPSVAAGARAPPTSSTDATARKSSRSPTGGAGASASTDPRETSWSAGSRARATSPATGSQTSSSTPSWTPRCMRGSANADQRGREWRPLINQARSAEWCSTSDINTC